MNLLLRGGMVFCGKTFKQEDILVQDGKITQISAGIALHGAQEINITGCIVSPGFTDLHVHLRQPGFEEKETIATGTAAAAAGGFTTVCAMPNLKPVPDTRLNLQTQLSAIEKEAVVQVLPYGAITVGEKGQQLADISQLASLVCGFSDDGRGVQKEDTMRLAMEQVAREGSFIAAHCEVESLLPEDGVCVQQGSSFAQANGWQGCSAESEWREVERDIALAAATGCRLHICHASTAKTFDLVRRAKAKGLPVSCEATPHNLLLSCEDITEGSGKFRMNPPLRFKEDVEAAVIALQDGTIDAIATDHAPHTDSEKLGLFKNSANGVVGLETAFAACYTGLVKTGILSLERLLFLLSTGPQKVLGGPVPVLTAGAPANITVLDLERHCSVDPAKFATMGRATPFQGAELWGWPVLTLVAGRVAHTRL